MECVCVYYYRTYYKAVRVGEEESGGHVLMRYDEPRLVWTCSDCHGGLLDVKKKKQVIWGKDARGATLGGQCCASGEATMRVNQRGS